MSSTSMKDLSIKNTDDQVVMDNMLIHSKRQTNLLESKIEVLAIKKLQTDPITEIAQDAKGKDYELDGVCLNTKELKILIPHESGAIYDQVHVAADRMMKKYVVIENPETHQFEYTHYYHKVKYSDGKLNIIFEPEMKPYLMNLSANFTKLSMPILWSFHTNGAFQLYIQLRSYVYKISESPSKAVRQEDAETLKKDYNLAELRALMGYVALDDDANDKVRREANKKNPDWDKISNLEKTPKYKRWSDFSSRVLKPGIKEINDKSDIYVSDMQPIRTGRGGKITGVSFDIQYNKKFYNAGASTDEVRIVDEKGIVEEKYEHATTEQIAEILSIFPEDENLVNPVEAEILYNDSRGSIKRIKDAYEYIKKIDRVDNFMGYMRRAISDNYAGTQPIEVMNGSKNEAIRYHELTDLTEQEEKKYCEKYWTDAKSKGTEYFKKFVRHLEDNGSSLEEFEGDKLMYECGVIFLNWISSNAGKKNKI